MHDCAAFTAVVFLLPLVHLANELQEGALGHRRVPVHGPAQELELLHHPISILGLEGIRQQSRSGEKTGIVYWWNSSRLILPAWTSQQSRPLLKDRPAYKYRNKLPLAWRATSFNLELLLKQTNKQTRGFTWQARQIKVKRTLTALQKPNDNTQREHWPRCKGQNGFPLIAGNLRVRNKL